MLPHVHHFAVLLPAALPPCGLPPLLPAVLPPCGLLPCCLPPPPLAAAAPPPGAQLSLAKCFGLSQLGHVSLVFSPEPLALCYLPPPLPHGPPHVGDLEVPPCRKAASVEQQMLPKVRPPSASKRCRLSWRRSKRRRCPPRTGLWPGPTFPSAPDVAGAGIPRQERQQLASLSGLRNQLKVLNEPLPSQEALLRLRFGDDHQGLLPRNHHKDIIQPR